MTTEKYIDITSKINKEIKERINTILGTNEWILSCFNGYNTKVKGYHYRLAKKFKDEKFYRDLVSCFDLVQMPGCCGVGISTNSHVYYGYRNKGIGSILNSLRIVLARLDGYSILMCTDVESNEYQRKILIKNGWKDIHKFVNKRTNNTIFISVINL